MSTALSRFATIRNQVRPSWMSVIGIILVPFVVAGILVWALWDPQERLDQVNAAIVNNDQPVTIDEQTVPLGRQLSAGLVGGGDTADDSDADSSINYNWIITDEDDAADGLASGTYTAVVTIPENFSAAATSFSGEAADAEKATIDVATSDKSRIVDDAISQVITTTAAGLVGTQLTTSYLENIYLGFNTLGDRLGEAADGAGQLSDGAVSLADGITTLADGTAQLQTGASGLATGVSSYAGGVTKLSGGLSDLSNSTSALPSQTQSLATGASAVATGVDGLISTVGTQGELLAQVAQGCSPADDAYCAAVLQYLQQAQQAAAANPNGSAQLSGAAHSVASGSQALADGMATLSGGIAQLTGAASTLSGAGSELSSGANTLSDGVAGIASGSSQLATGATSLSDGVASLSSGLAEAVDAIPNYSEKERTQLATVVANPVVTDSGNEFGFGSNGVPFYAVLALWLGALASFIVLRAFPAGALGSTKSSVVLAVRAWLPAAGVGALQGLLVTGILSFLIDLDVASWFGFAAIAALIGVAFAATNQALNALFGGAGRFISMIVALILIGTSIIATAPPILDSVQAALPIQPALSALAPIVNSSAGGAAAVTGLVLWTLGGLAITSLAIARKRTVTVRQLVPRVA